MSQDPDYKNGEQGDLSQFRKNRFFSGKLMTPRDMEAEQEYHAERLQTLVRFVIGSGIVHGLEVQSISDADDGLEVTIGPGMALDGRGRPIVVERVTTKSLPQPSASEMSLYLQYDEVSVETVPVPNTDDAIGEESTSNRTVEVFELTFRETTANGREVAPNVETPSVGPDRSDAERISQQLLEQYHDRHRSSVPSDEDVGVFLGSFERAPDGSWMDTAEPAPREFVYDHDLLFGTIIDHITDTDNPHRTPVEREPPDIPDDLEAVTDRLDALEADLGRIERDQTALRRYVMRKTLKDRARFFTEVADRLDGRTSQGSRLAREIAAVARADGEQICDSEDAYRHHLQHVLEHLIDLGDHLEGDDSVLALAEAQDRVCEAADSLEVLVTIVPDE